MANTTVPFAESVHGTNPQYLIEKITRLKIYNSTYWKEHCFGLTSELIIDKAIALKYCGGVYGGNTKPCNFLCLVLKLLQLQPEKEIILEFIRNEEFKYLRLLGAFYLRMVGRPDEVYEYLEPLYNDYRKVAYRSAKGWQLTYVDEFVHWLLSEEMVCDITLPHITRREKLEDLGQLEPRRSVLEDEFNEAEEEESDDENEDKVGGASTGQPVDEKPADYRDSKPSGASPVASQAVRGPVAATSEAPAKERSDTREDKSSMTGVGDRSNADTDRDAARSSRSDAREPSSRNDHSGRRSTSRGRDGGDSRSAHQRRSRSRSRSRSRERGDRDQEWDRRRDYHRRSRSRSDDSRRRRGGGGSSRRRGRSRSYSSDSDYDRRRRRDDRDRPRHRRRSDSRDADRGSRDRKRSRRSTSRSRSRSRSRDGASRSRREEDRKERRDESRTVAANAGGEKDDFERRMDAELAQAEAEAQKRKDEASSKKFDKMFGKSTKPAAAGEGTFKVDKSKFAEGSVEYWNEMREKLGMSKLKS